MLNAVNENGEKQESFNAGENIIKITMQKDDMSLTYTIKVNKKESIAVILTICLIEGLLLKLPWKKMIMACKRKKGFGEEDDELDNDIDENQE